MNNVDGVPIRLCDCGRIHIEGRHFRLSFQPEEFLAMLRNRAQAAVLPAMIGVLTDSKDEGHHYFPIPQERFHGAPHTD